MKSFSVPLGFLFSLSLAGPLSAQESSLADIPPPTAPFVAPVPVMAQWTISVDYTYTNEKSGDSDQPASPGGSGNGSAPTLALGGKNPLALIRSIRTGTIKYDTMIYKDGRSSEYWYDGNQFFSPGPGGAFNAYNVSILAPDPYLDPLGPEIKERGNLTQSIGFPGLDWVKSKYYVNVALVGGKACYYYVFPVGKTNFAEAWIDVKTKLPVQYSGAGALYTFSFGATPTAQLSLPPAAASLLAKVQQSNSYSRSLESAVGH